MCQKYVKKGTWKWGNNFTLSPEKVYNSNVKQSDLKDFLKARFVKKGIWK